MQRFYVAFPLSIDLELTDPDIVHQLMRVLRVQIGEEITLFDGDGSETIYTITAISKKSLTLRGKNRTFPTTEPSLNIALYQALPNKIEKIEYILQKGVEVGIQKFHFFRSDYSQKLVITDAKLSRFHSIIKEALEQCGGVHMPEMIFSQGFPPVDDIPHIVLDTVGKIESFQNLPKSSSLGLWIGPEGGWSPDERKKMQYNGFIFARFGERVLRTETAGIVASFALLHR